MQSYSAAASIFIVFPIYDPEIAVSKYIKTIATLEPGKFLRFQCKVKEKCGEKYFIQFYDRKHANYTILIDVLTIDNIINDSNDI